MAIPSKGFEQLGKRVTVGSGSRAAGLSRVSGPLIHLQKELEEVWAKCEKEDSGSFERFFWGEKEGNPYHYKHYSRIATNMRIKALLKDKDMNEQRILDTEGFIEKDAAVIADLAEKLPLQSNDNPPKYGGRDGHEINLDSYVDETPYIAHPIAGLFEIFENLGHDLDEGEFPTFNWKFKNDFPNGVNATHGTKSYLLEHSTKELAMMWLAFKRSEGIFAERKKDGAAPTFTYTETYSREEAERIDKLAKHFASMFDDEPKPRTTRHKQRNDPTRSAALSNKVTKSRKAAKAAKKARKK